MTTLRTVTTRELDRHTGQIKKAALLEPVFITERGEVKYVLLSIEAYLEILKFS